MNKRAALGLILAACGVLLFAEGEPPLPKDQPAEPLAAAGTKRANGPVAAPAAPPKAAAPKAAPKAPAAAKTISSKASAAAKEAVDSKKAPMATAPAPKARKGAKVVRGRARAEAGAPHKSLKLAKARKGAKSPVAVKRATKAKGKLVALEPRGKRAKPSARS